jgi:hypothetical protein
MAPSDFANADIDEVVNQLTTQEAILLTAGVGFWHTHAIERLGIPAIKVRAPFLYIYRERRSQSTYRAIYAVLRSVSSILTYTYTTLIASSPPGQRRAEWHPRQPLLHGHAREMSPRKPAFSIARSYL